MTSRHEPGRLGIGPGIEETESKVAQRPRLRSRADKTAINRAENSALEPIEIRVVSVVLRRRCSGARKVDEPGEIQFFVDCTHQPIRHPGLRVDDIDPMNPDQFRQDGDAVAGLEMILIREVGGR